MKNQQRLIVGLVLTLVLIVFALLNGQAVEVNFFGAKMSWPLIVVIVGSLLIGALITFLVSTASLSQNKKALKAAQQAASNADAVKAQAVKDATAKLEAQVKDLNQQLAAAKAKVADPQARPTDGQGQ